MISKTLLATAATIGCLSNAADAASVSSASAEYRLRLVEPLPDAVEGDVLDLVSGSAFVATGGGTGSATDSGSGLSASIRSDTSTAGHGAARGGAFANSFAFYDNFGAEPATLSFVLDYALSVSAAADDAEAEATRAMSMLTLSVDGVTILSRAFDVRSGGTGMAAGGDSYVFDVVVDFTSEIAVEADVGSMAAVEIAAVPLPAGGLLMMGGLAALGLVRRRTA